MSKEKKDLSIKGEFIFDYVVIDDMIHVIRHKSDFQQGFWITGKKYEEDMIDFMKKNYKNKGGAFIDVGSSIGNCTLFFSSIADDVYSFEPRHETFFHQTLNLVVNELKNVHMFNVALGNERGVKKMVFDDIKYSCGGNAIKDYGENLVTINKLDDFNIENVRVMKIDVQEYETEVLNGAEHTIKNSLPDLFIECSTELEKQTTLKLLQSFDEEYKIYPQRFNSTPTYLFTVRKFGEFKNE